MRTHSASIFFVARKRNPCPDGKCENWESLCASGGKVDTTDLKSVAFMACGFNSRLAYHFAIIILFIC